MSRNRVIGVHGGLPWKIPDDRRYFKDLTRNAVLVLGRRTLEEHPERRHVAHASHLVVLSRTLHEDYLRVSSPPLPMPPMSVAWSFEAALDAARRIVLERKSSNGEEIDDDDSDRLDCWVVGGERVYNEALLHPSADQLHLTVVEAYVNEVADDHTKEKQQMIARFPAKYRWENKFRLLSTTAKTDKESGLKYRTDVFRRLKGRR
jgi:dihydrofolate reductase